MHPILNPSIDGEPGYFTATQRALFDVLNKSIGELVTHKTIYESLYGNKSRSEQSVRVQVSYLRLKLKTYSITNVHSAGYIMRRLNNPAVPAKEKAT